MTVSPDAVRSHLDALIVRVLALPACDGWTAALLRTVRRGDVDGAGLAVMLRARGDALSLALTRAAMRSGVTFGELAVLSAIEATAACMAGDGARALRSIAHARHHLACAQSLDGAA